MDLVEKVAREIAKSEGWELPNDMALPYGKGSRIGKTMAIAKIAIEAVYTRHSDGNQRGNTSEPPDTPEP